MCLSKTYIIYINIVTSWSANSSKSHRLSDKNPLPGMESILLGCLEEYRRLPKQHGLLMFVLITFYKVKSYCQRYHKLRTQNLEQSSSNWPRKLCENWLSGSLQTTKREEQPIMYLFFLNFLNLCFIHLSWLSHDRYWNFKFLRCCYAYFCSFVATLHTEVK